MNMDMNEKDTSCRLNWEQCWYDFHYFIPKESESTHALNKGPKLFENSDS